MPGGDAGHARARQCAWGRTRVSSRTDATAIILAEVRARPWRTARSDVITRVMRSVVCSRGYVPAIATAADSRPEITGSPAPTPRSMNTLEAETLAKVEVL